MFSVFYLWVEPATAGSRYLSEGLHCGFWGHEYNINLACHPSLLVGRAPLTGLEPVHLAPEASALSSELQGQIIKLDSIPEPAKAQTVGWSRC
jgi:hypothetical protein